MDIVKPFRVAPSTGWCAVELSGQCRTWGGTALLMEENIAPPELPLRRAGAQSILHAHQTPACSFQGELWSTVLLTWGCWKKKSWLLCHLNPACFSLSTGLEGQCHGLEGWKGSAMQTQEQQSEILLYLGNPLTLRQLNIPIQMADFFPPFFLMWANWCFLKYWR